MTPTGELSRPTHAMRFADSYRISDEEAVAMSRYLVTHDGLYLGSSSACNLVASVKLAKRLGQGCRIATILWVSLGIVPVMLGTGRLTGQVRLWQPASEQVLVGRISAGSRHSYTTRTH
jgi:hypothetical protein